MINLIGLSGYAQVGKDTVASILTEERGFFRVAFADPIKEAALRLNPLVRTPGLARVMALKQLIELYGWDRSKVDFPEVREFMQRLGVEVGRELLGDDVWIDAAFRKAEALGLPRIVITDCRFPNEADAIKKRGGEVWRVNRHGYGPANDHSSETAMDDYHGFDWHIWNTGPISYLRESVLRALPAN